MIFFDGRNGRSFRQFLGARMATSRAAAFALRRVRLARLDLLPNELARLEECRVLLGRLDAETLAAPGLLNRAERGATRPPDIAALPSLHIAALLDMAASGRLHVRSAGLASWDPDFSILCGADGADLLLLGSHQFNGGEPSEALTLSFGIADASAIRAASRHFEELWECGYDTLEAVTDALCRARSTDEL